MTAMLHAHGPNYVETRRGFCRWHHHHEDVELACESPNLAGSEFCVRHHLATDLGITDAEAGQLLADYAARVREGLR